MKITLSSFPKVNKIVKIEITKQQYNIDLKMYYFIFFDIFCDIKQNYNKFDKKSKLKKNYRNDNKDKEKMTFFSQMYKHTSQFIDLFQ